MKRQFLVLGALFLLILNNLAPAQAYFFATDLEAQVLTLNDKEIELIVTQHDDKNETEVFPIGTIFKGKFFEYSFKKHFLRDEYLKLHLYQAILPNQKIIKVDKDIKIRPRVIISNKHSIQLGGAILATVLKFTVAVWSVGFPTGRGIKAVTDSAYAVYDTPSKESKWKQGTKGFVKGALFPLPELVLKGEELPIHNESYIWIQDAKEHEKKLTAFILKRKNIYLHKEKYYQANNIKEPNFTKYLKAKDLAKYKKKLAKKSVKAKVKKS